MVFRCGEAARPTARTPPPPSRRPRQSLALRPSVRATMSRLAPPFASRRSLPAAPVTPLAPKPRAPSQCSRYDVPARPAVRTPPFASRRPRDATRAKASHSVPVFASRHPGSSRRPNSAAPVTPSAPRRLAPPRALRTGRPPAPHLIEATRVSCDLRPLETLAFCAAAQEFGAPPQTPAGAQGSVSPLGCWAEGPKRPEAGQRNHERDRQGSAND